MYQQRNRRSGNKNNFRRRYAPSGVNTADIIRAIRSVCAVKNVREADIPQSFAPLHRFDDFPINEILKSNIRTKKYGLPTQIQDEAIGAIITGRDVVGVANTGTGKTAAFLIPLVDKIYKNRSEKVFILAPTRELALQINEELTSFTRRMGIYSALCVGGLPMFRQIKDLRRNPSFVIGTPGRIKDLIQEKHLSLSQFKTVVLDEADRMVDIGFIDEIKYFISLFPPVRQSLFFSATISGKVRETLNAFVRNPLIISVKHQDTAENIDQSIVELDRSRNKVDQLHDLLIKDGFSKVLIFGRTKWGVQKLADELVSRGFRAGALHGNKRQSQRQKVMDQFKKGEINILLATDVASRGLDIREVSHVINYDLPASYDDYVHRIGRTGRANNKGIALTLVEKNF